jgi:ADP-ribose pyrophosphatase YjhB (NUDIX family)
MAIPKDKEKQNYMFSEDMKFLQKAVLYHPTDRRRFLALKREPNDHSRAGKWDLPGGNLHFGQVAEQGLRREIREESGLEVTGIRPIQVWSKYFGGTKVYHLFIGYTARALSAKVVISYEHTEFRWVTKPEFLQLDSADFLIDMVNLV